MGFPTDVSYTAQNCKLEFCHFEGTRLAYLSATLSTDFHSRLLRFSTGKLLSLGFLWDYVWFQCTSCLEFSPLSAEVCIINVSF